MVDIPFIGKKKEEEKDEESSMEVEVIKHATGDNASGFLAEDQVQLLSQIIEPASGELYNNKSRIEEVGEEDGKKIYRQTPENIQKIMRDLALGNYGTIDEEIITNYLMIAEHCEDMGFDDAADFYTKLAYQLVNISRGRTGFLQKQLGTKAVEFKKTQETKKKEGFLR